MALTYDQRLKVADIAKELTLEFGGKLKYTNTSNEQAMNENLTENINKLYADIFKKVEGLVEDK